MKKRYFLFTALSITLSFISQAQTSFQTTYGGRSEEYCNAGIQTNDGGYLAVGGTTNFGVDWTDIMIVKLDSLGNKEWLKTYGGSRHDEAWDVIQNADDSYIVVGTSSSRINDYDTYVLKLDQFGDTIWTKSMGESGFDKGYNVRKTTDGGYIIGSENSDLSPKTQLIKLSTTGNLFWNKTYENRISAIDLCTDDGVIIGGYTGSAGSFDFTLIRTDNIGSIKWARTFQTTTDNRSSGVLACDDGGFIITGNGDYQNRGNIMVVKTDSNGTTLWANNYEMGICAGTDIIQTSDGGYALTGHSFKAGILLKLDYLGAIEWKRVYGGGGQANNSSSERINSLKQTSDGGYFAIGTEQSSPPNTGMPEYWLIKTDVNGFAGCNEDTATFTSTAISPINTLYTPATGAGLGIHNIIIQIGTPVVDTALFCISTSIEDFRNETKCKVFPNPATGNVSVQVEGIKNIEVADLQGRLILNEEVKTKNENYDIDISNQPQGVYMINIITDTEIITNKIIKQ